MMMVQIVSELTGGEAVGLPAWSVRITGMMKTADGVNFNVNDSPLSRRYGDAIGTGAIPEDGYQPHHRPVHKEMERKTCKPGSV